MLRYDVAGFGLGLYVMEAGPLVKIGKACSAYCRLTRCHRAFKAMGHEPGRWSFVRITGDMNDCECKEKKCIAALRKIAKPYLTKREFFTEVAFDEAERIVREIAAA